MEMRSDDPVVVVTDVHKWYRTYAAATDRVRRLIGLKSRFADFRALDGVSLSIPRGKAVAVIGENGAGKSTLLKLVAGTTSPTSGRIHVEGRVAAILELGAAFHPEFTGRDNAVLYGALVGHRADEMQARLEQIIDFAELGHFIDHPIKTYSTGMVMRLAFAVATHVDADVLIVDEALAVGDGYFQKKCVDRLLAIKQSGTTVLFCTHAMYYVSMFCELAVWLHQGKVRAAGPAPEVVDAYERHLLLRDKRRIDELPDSEVESSHGRRVGRITDVAVRHQEASQPECLDLEIDVEVRTTDPAERFHVGVSLDTLDGKCVLAEATFLDGWEPVSGRESFRTTLSFPNLALVGGAFSVHAYLLDETGLHVHDTVVVPEALVLRRERWHPALIGAPHSWNLAPV
jgi:lipopolysaccharide transport system ATP-binding protein